MDCIGHLAGLVIAGIVGAFVAAAVVQDIDVDGKGAYVVDF